MLVLEVLVRLHRTVHLPQHYWSGRRLGLLWYWMVCLGNKQRSFHHFWDCIQAASCSDCISSVQSLSRLRLFVTPWTAACQASLSITNSQSLRKLMSIESVIPSNHLILRCPPFLPPSIFPSIGVFSNESVLRIRWPKYWSFSFNISPSNEHPGLISFRMDWLDLHAVQGLSRVFSNTTVQKHRFFSAWLSL